MDDVQVVELTFPIMGGRIPVDHGYALYSAVSKAVSTFHQLDDIRLGLIRGRYSGEGFLDISPRASMHFRLPADRIPVFLPLAGKTIAVHGAKLQIGIPRPSLLEPASSVYSHFVTTRNGDQSDRFEKEIRRQLEALEVRATLVIGRRKTMKIHGKQVVGHEVRLSDLSDADSLTVQASGLGGRSKMGCGFFIAEITH